jgi:predicted HicB family RNase H-like nuclease
MTENRGGRRKGAGRPKGTTRPTKPTSRTEQVSTRLTKEGLSRVVDAARAMDISVAEFIRQAVGMYAWTYLPLE